MAFSKFSSAFDGKSGHHYDPNQPRVPAGQPDGGQWTAEGGHGASAPLDDAAVISDATPDDDWQSGAQYASRARGTRRGGSPTAGQAVRLTFAEARATAAVRAVQQREPNWQPTPSVYQTVEGQIAALEARAQEAEARLAELARNGIGPGPFARESIPARGPERNFTAAERAQNNRNGDRWGCHTCGTKDPGNPWATWFGDHQEPNKLNELFGREQRIYPHCASCSGKQGAWIAHWLRMLKENLP